MSSEAQNVIAGVVQKHQWHGGILGCGRGCDWRPSFDRTWACGEEDRLSREHAAHVAEEIDKALGGLTAESRPRGLWRCPDPAPKYIESRWVSGWSEA
ncbi:hypothetical protein SEA_MODRAGONS_88 [Mycobacterium phage Modragons]|uniref:Uncharacterized protein n=2 Tax=Gracegardnervirinae TaxID=2946632 RepID=Q855L9_9CAUD|nr:hypothetical protein PBI_CHE9D_94 [Mycobacterium phage Che9d]YP_009209639.1 hypothetical protein PBI_LLAMA_90 [Mycobacterium phage Llama]YP_010101103.1 hypothetical protein KNU45_gp089 [Mycobacterium phage Ochi17]QFP96469.1 hypothetical protein SEA_MODRAGONS_88 [Mycobacterium phage Modragons]QOP67174.1 hypothetical protein SEA_SEABASTIAN_91 [Mycobacterium phage Seabastian]QOP67285.1 hypothetical protein SEA_OFULTRON_91 [Mycobacterium phage OfUltron]AAN08012.1 hypothetical protein PBI_CHE9D